MVGGIQGWGARVRRGGPILCRTGEQAGRGSTASAPKPKTKGDPDGSRASWRPAAACRAHASRATWAGWQRRLDSVCGPALVQTAGGYYFEEGGLE
eukprot:scaffold9007_cov112-Isochrysis_galbana.AAC.2